MLDGDGSSEVSFTATGERTGFADRVGPIIVDHCASCHNPGGPGAAHWYLSTARDVADVATFIGRELESGSMPPWPASDIGVPYVESLGLTDEELADVLGWLDTGALLDVDPSAPMIGPSIASLRDPLVVAPTEPYAGEGDRLDDYRCLVYQPELAEGAWLRGHQFVADRTEVVHHAIGYLVPGDQWPTAKARDAADPGSGWECFGGTGLAGDTFVMGWAPGQLPEVYPDGTGLWMEPGDFLVVQVHYTTTSIRVRIHRTSNCRWPRPTSISSRCPSPSTSLRPRSRAARGSPARCVTGRRSRRDLRPNLGSFPPTSSTPCAVSPRSRSHR